MSSDTVISAKNLTKIYRIFNHPGDRIKQALTLGQVKFHKEFTAINNVSLEIKKGETVGIIGRNGSGKSTLLQLICGILKPTHGSVVVKGRISALLELGAGFNSEFTGRENVYFQGAIMGLSEQQINDRFDEIAAFADIGGFIDQPVRTYSSGMYIRLAFAVAIHVEPEILVVDEALAVGDMAFQRKCFEHLSLMMNNSGTTVVLVSHDLKQIQKFCSRVIFLDHGLCIADGESRIVCQKYYEMSFNKSQHGNADSSFKPIIMSSNEVELLSIVCVDKLGNEITEISSGDQLQIKVSIKFNRPIRNPELVIGTQTADLTYLSSSSTMEFDMQWNFGIGVYGFECIFEQFPLCPGTYYIFLVVKDEYSRLVFGGQALNSFSVKPEPRDLVKFTRLLNLDTKWKIDSQVLTSFNEE